MANENNITENFKCIAFSLIMEAEGFRANVYKCPAGKRTIGYGRNIDDLPLNDEEANLTFINGNGDLTITKENAQRLLKIQIDTLSNNLQKRFDFFSKLNDERKAVILDMAYNLGTTKLYNFKKMIAALENEDYKKASEEMVNSKWFNQVGSRGTRNVKIMLNGAL